jgi:hypothetical protein
LEPIGGSGYFTLNFVEKRIIIRQKSYNNIDFLIGGGETANVMEM